MKPQLGTVFWMDDPSGGHDYVILTPPTQPEIVIVNFTSNGPRKDQSCVLQPGEHPVVTRESVVAYNFAQVVPTSALLKWAIDGEIVEKAKASYELMLKIWAGADVTRRMTLRCQQLYQMTIGAKTVEKVAEQVADAEDAEDSETLD